MTKNNAAIIQKVKQRVICRNIHKQENIKYPYIYIVHLHQILNLV